MYIRHIYTTRLVLTSTNSHKIHRNQARAELEKLAAEREAMREKKQSNNRKEEQVIINIYI